MFEVYNNTESQIVIQGVTIDATPGSVTVPNEDVLSWCKDPLFCVNIINSSLGISVNGTDLGYSFSSPADVWCNRVAAGHIVY